MYVPLWRGIRVRSLRRAPRLWWGYVCWWIAANASIRRAAPGWLYRAAGRLTPRTWALRSVDSQSRAETVRVLCVKASPGPGWLPFGVEAVHSVVTACWVASRRIERWARQWCDPFMARCDWTDPVCGLLYGGRGSGLQGAFEQMVADISPSQEQEAAAIFAATDMHEHLSGLKRNGTVH